MSEEQKKTDENFVYAQYVSSEQVAYTKNFFANVEEKPKERQIETVSIKEGLAMSGG